MRADRARTPEELNALSEKHARYINTGSTLRLATAYGHRVRATLWCKGHVLSSVDKADRLGLLVKAMRLEMNKEDFCPTCGALRGSR
jgi:hypothetical protein